MTNTELLAKIKAEIERLYDGEAPKHDQQCDFDDGYFTGIGAIAQFIDSLESEKSMNQEGLDVTDFCKSIDPSIAQCIADHSWEMLGEDEKPVLNDLEEAADNHIRKVADAAGHPGWDWTTQDIAEAFIAEAKWQAEQLLKSSPLPEDTVLFNKGVEEGRRLAEEEQADLFTIVALDAAQRAKEQMMKEAVEGEIQMRYSGCLCAKTIRAINEDKFKFGDKVRIIIVKEDEV